MAIAITLRGFSDLVRSVIPIFSLDGPFSFTIFYVLRKTEENLSSRSLNFLRNVPWNSMEFRFKCLFDG